MAFGQTAVNSVAKSFGFDLPIRNIIKNWEEAAKYTPDVARLTQRQNWNVFLYCDLQHKMDDTHPLVGDHVWDGFTRDHYTMWKNDLGKLSYPVIFKDDRLKAVEHNKVRGIVVRMRTQRLIDLDAGRLNGVQFQRIRVPITIPHYALMKVKDRPSHQRLHGGGYLRGDRQIIPCEHKVWAWMYVGKPDYWLDDLRKILTAKIIRADARRNDEHTLIFDGKTVPSATRYLPNDENKEPYYFFPPPT